MRKSFVAADLAHGSRASERFAAQKLAAKRLKFIVIPDLENARLRHVTERVDLGEVRKKTTGQHFAARKQRHRKKWHRAERRLVDDRRFLVTHPLKYRLILKPVERKNLPANFCPIPFTDLIFSQEGVVRCCRDNWLEELGRIEKDSDILELWNGPKIRQWRREFLDGDPRICKDLIRDRQCNRWNDDLLKFVELKEVQDRPPVKFAPLLNGQCNLECIMCEIWYKKNGHYDATRFWEQAESEIFPHIKIADIYGGEPFVQKDTFKLIEKISAVNPACRWRFYTNGHWKFNAKIKSLLDRLNIDWMHFSVDSLHDETFAKIRLKGRLPAVIETLHGIKDYAKQRQVSGRGFKVGLQVVAQRMNWKELPHFVQYAREHGFNLVFLYAYNPSEVSLSTLPLEEKRPILDYLFDSCTKVGGTQLLSVTNTLLNSLSPDERDAFTAGT